MQTIIFGPQAKSAAAGASKKVVAVVIPQARHIGIGFKCVIKGMSVNNLSESTKITRLAVKHTGNAAYLLVFALLNGSV